MAKLVRVFDRQDANRRLNLIIKNIDYPGLLEFLSSVQFGIESELLRGIIYQWYSTHTKSGTLEMAVPQLLAEERHRIDQRFPQMDVSVEKVSKPKQIPKIEASNAPPTPTVTDQISLERQIESAERTLDIKSERQSPRIVTTNLESGTCDQDDIWNDLQAMIKLEVSSNE